MTKMRALTRYWFMVPLILIVVGLQLGIGLVVVKGAGFGFKIVKQGQVHDEQGSRGAGVENDSSPLLAPLPPGAPSPPVVLSTSIPTATPTPTLAPPPTLTPSPTHTPTPTETPAAQPPAETLTPPTPPSPTPTSTFTPTPGPTPIGQAVTLDVPILMYHYISIPPADANDVRLDLSVTPAQFESHLAYLRQAGYETISMRQLAYALSRQVPLPPNPIIITFDDGYRDNYENAFPLLRKYGYTGVFFIFTYPLDNDNPDYLSWDMVVEMHKAGMEFGSHTYRHSNLWNRDVDFQIFEILASKEAIEARIGEPVYFFSYPFGYYDDLTIRILDSAHFWGAVTTEFDIEQSFGRRFEMPRVRLHGYDAADDLARKLNAF